MEEGERNLAQITKKRSEYMAKPLTLSNEKKNDWSKFIRQYGTPFSSG
jgi:hypothetical protein